ESEKSAAKAEAERRRRFRFVLEACVVEAQLCEAFAELLEIGGVHGKEAAEDDRQVRLESRQRLERGFAIVGDGVAHLTIRDRLDLGIDIADLAGAEL